MRATRDEQAKLQQRLSEDGEWALSRDLFGDTGADIHDFEMQNYIYFLDNAKSLKDLREGLRQLSPLADDALAVAESMSEKGFRKFKLALLSERLRLTELTGGEQLPLFSALKGQKMPRKFSPLLIPRRFIMATLEAEKFGVCLGVTLIRIMELEA